VQDFGLEDGLPFTAYREGMVARKETIAYLTPKIEALLAKHSLDDKDTVIGLIVTELESAGVDVASNTRCA
jgi:hypothetical protein